MSSFGLIGDKLTHSFSKVIHEYFYKEFGLKHDYSLIEVSKENVSDVINKIKSNQLAGINVTIPHKEEVMKYLSYLNDDVLDINACNTVTFKDNVLGGYNTDYLGFKELIKYYNIDLNNKKIYILGSGGSSKAVYYALKDYDVKVVSRNPKLEEISYNDIDYKNAILVNTTPLGMFPNVDASPCKKSDVEVCYAVIDLLYNPKTTLLMSYNKNSYNGFIMLLSQALHAINIWNDTNYKLTSKMISELEVLCGVK